MHYKQCRKISSSLHHVDYAISKVNNVGYYEGEVILYKKLLLVYTKSILYILYIEKRYQVVFLLS